VFRDIPEYREVPCIRECQEDQALVGVVVEEGEHNMMADTEERRREHSLHHMDSSLPSTQPASFERQSSLLQVPQLKQPRLSKFEASFSTIKDTWKCPY